MVSTAHMRRRIVMFISLQTNAAGSNVVVFLEGNSIAVVSLEADHN